MRGPRPAPLQVRLFSPSGNSQMATCAWLAQLVQYTHFLFRGKKVHQQYIVEVVAPAPRIRLPFVMDMSRVPMAT